VLYGLDDAGQPASTSVAPVNAVIPSRTSPKCALAAQPPRSPTLVPPRSPGGSTAACCLSRPGPRSRCLPSLPAFAVDRGGRRPRHGTTPRWRTGCDCVKCVRAHAAGV